MPGDLKENEEIPLILDMNCTTGNPRAEVKTNGWDRAAHIPHDFHADIAWDFFRHFRREDSGDLEEA